MLWKYRTLLLHIMKIKNGKHDQTLNYGLYETRCNKQQRPIQNTCADYITPFMLLSCLFKQSLIEWCAFENRFERVFFWLVCLSASSFFHSILTVWTVSYFDPIFYSVGLIFGSFKMSITIVLHVSKCDLNETTQYKNVQLVFFFMPKTFTEKTGRKDGELTQISS